MTFASKGRTVARIKEAHRPDPRVTFAEKLLSLLETGSFTASYKYALLLAILDETLEQTGVHGQVPASLPGRHLGRRVFELYWPQSRVYAGHRSTSELGTEAGARLRQASVRGDIVSRIADVRAELGVRPEERLESVRRRAPETIEDVERHVVWRVMRNPIPRLQVFGGQKTGRLDAFIYEEVSWGESLTMRAAYDEAFDDTLKFAPSAAQHLVELAGVLRPVIEREWLRYVARRNQLPEAQLEQHLFGSERRALRRLVPWLRRLQNDRCFYCSSEGNVWEVDHFLPWARWPEDRLDNLVLAHGGCNNSKRSAFAALAHLERWLERFDPNSRVHSELAAAADEHAWPRDDARTLGAAAVLYGRQPDGTVVWLRPGKVEPLDAKGVREAFSAVEACRS